jgi:hypothetical protein
MADVFFNPDPPMTDGKAGRHGDSVGHYEGDTLVIDTLGTKTDRPFAMLDLYGTPFTEKLQVVERYRLLSYQEAKEAWSGTPKRISVRRWTSTAIAGASICRSSSRLRMRVPSRRPGLRPLPMGAAAANGRKSYAQKTADVPTADQTDF